MKKIISVILAALLLAGAGAVGASAAIWPEMQLGVPKAVTNDIALMPGITRELSFIPTVTGWYTFEAICDKDHGVGASHSINLTDSNGNTMPGPHIQLFDYTSGTSLKLPGAVSQLSDRQSYSLAAGSEYFVSFRTQWTSPLGVPSDFTDTFELVVREPKDVTNRGSFIVNNVTLKRGAPLRMDQLFAAPPVYNLMRVKVTGYTFGKDNEGYLTANDLGEAALVFYDMAGNQIGSSRVTVVGWWDSLPNFVQWLLRIFAFGWIWMR